VIDFVRRVVSHLQGVGMSRTAASLAFTTLLALVPLATVTFAIVARFPVFDVGLTVFEEWAERVLMPGVGHGVVRNAIIGFAEQAARLTGVTIAFIALTAALLVAEIEHEFNAIFGVRRARPLARRVLVYVLGVTIGPIVAGASISVTTWLIGQSLDAVSLQAALSAWIGRPLPWLLGAAVFTLAYKIVPFCPVRWRHAAVGGVLAAAGFEAAKAGFALYVTNVPTYRLMYGALAVLPLFMLWIYLCWTIVLVGAAIVSALTPGSRRDADR
jgi:membrane protein